MQTKPVHQSSTEATWLYFRKRFERHFAPMVHDQIRIDRVFRPGPGNYPVVDTYPFVLWRPEWVSHFGAHRQADVFFQELYQSAVLQCRQADLRREDEQSITALALYAIWRFRHTWLFTISDLIQSGRIRHRQSDVILQVSCILAAVQGEIARAAYWAGQVRGTDPVFTLLLEQTGVPAVHSREPGGVTATDPTQALPAVKRLLWFEAIFQQDETSEAILLRKRSKNPPIEEDELLDVYASLLARGRLFRAQRLLLKHLRLFGYRSHLADLVLQQYLINGRYLPFLRRLSQFERYPRRRNWYDAVFAIAALGQFSRMDTILAQLEQNHSVRHVPVDQSRMSLFQEYIRSALESGFTVSASQLGDLFDYPALLGLLHADRPRQIQQSFRLFDSLLPRSPLKGQAVNSERLAFLFAGLEDKFRQYQDRPQVQAVWPVLQALAGRVVAIRIWLGLSAWEQGFTGTANCFLGSGPALSLEQSHVRAELALERGDAQTALQIYQGLLKRYPGQSRLMYNLASIQERLGSKDEALELYRQALDLDPTLHLARDRISLLDD
ncbi:MAG: tetratricopeptide repeat protein [Leptospiraceae bacterium]|nr:tetratricopeptide repeat protein [Leptospiraceae bacterium]